MEDIANNFNFTKYCPTNETDGFEETVRHMVPLFFGIIGITGLIGNVLVILVVLSNPQMQSTTNILIINLATADLLFVIFCIPFTATDYITNVWPFGNLWCKVVQYIIVVTVHASIYTLVLMSLDRFLAVVYPVASRSWRTERNTFKACSILWIVVLISAIPVIFLHGLESFDFDKQHILSCKLKADESTATIYQLVFFSSSYVLPLILISGLYLRMCIRLWRTVASGARRSHRGRVTRLVVVVVLAFASFWLPIQIILVLKILGKFITCTKFDIILQIFSHVLAYATSCINPLLYAFLSDNFRKAFRKAMYCGSMTKRCGLHQLQTKSIRTNSTVYGEQV